MENNTATNTEDVKEQAGITVQDDVPVDLTDEQTIDLFIEGLIEEKGLKSDSEELKKDVFSDLKTRLMEEIDRSLIAELPDEKLDELSKEAAKNGKLDAEVVAKAVEEAGIDVEEVMGMTMAKFKDIYLGNKSSGDAIDDNMGAEKNGEE